MAQATGAILRRREDGAPDSAPIGGAAANVVVVSTDVGAGAAVGEVAAVGANVLAVGASVCVGAALVGVEVGA